MYKTEVAFQGSISFFNWLAVVFASFLAASVHALPFRVRDSLPSPASPREACNVAAKQRNPKTFDGWENLLTVFARQKHMFFLRHQFCTYGDELHKA